MNGCGYDTQEHQPQCDIHDVVQHVACVFFFQAEDGIRDSSVTGVQTCALPIFELMSSSQLKYAMAALLKRTSIRPKLCTAKSTNARQSAGLLRWHGCKETIVPPAARTASTVASAAST